MTESEFKVLKDKADAGDARAQYDFCLTLFDMAGKIRVATAGKYEHGTWDNESLLESLGSDALTFRSVSQMALAYCEKAAESGIRDALLLAGTYYLYGMMVVPVDYGKAERFLNMALSMPREGSGQDEATLYMSLSQVYEKLGDKNKAMDWMRKAAGAGDLVASYSYAGKCYEAGDFDEAFTYYSRVESAIVADENDPCDYHTSLLPLVYRRLGLMCLEGRGVDEDPHKALDYLNKVDFRNLEEDERRDIVAKCQQATLAIASNTHDPEWLCKAASIYQMTGSKFFDYGKAFECFSAAYSMGYQCAREALANMYYYGHGVAQDTSKYLELMEPVAESSWGLAQQIQSIYGSGHGNVPANPEKALYWSRIADRLYPADANNGWGPWGR